MFISSLSQSPVTGISYEFTGYIFSNCLGIAPSGDVKIISWKSGNSGNFLKMLWNFLWDLESEYGFTAEQGKRIIILVFCSGSNVLIVLCLNSWKSGLLYDDAPRQLIFLFFWVIGVSYLIISKYCLSKILNIEIKFVSSKEDFSTNARKSS